jgi:N-acetyl-gamma-glutamyl-phosphate reductase
MHKVFVDGHEGTTGLEINERLRKRDDVEILTIDADKRKDARERGRLINRADIVFLCLPDDAARESVSLVNNPDTRIIDPSTAHRTAEGWDYGIPELSAEHRQAVKTSKRVSNPGCYATGFVMLMYPLVKEGFVPSDYPVTCHSVSGYSGGGRKVIERFESADNREKLNSPCFYALSLKHKHLPEMQKHSGLKNPPLFTPIISNYYRGMTVAIPLYAEMFGKKADAAELNAFYNDYYKGQKFVKVLPPNVHEEFEWGFMNAESCNYTNNIEIMVFGDDRQILAVSRLDNLGKGASGSAIQNMNIMLGIDEDYCL